MLCKKCGNNVKSDFKYCPYCGERIVSDYHDHYEELTPPFLVREPDEPGRCGGVVRVRAGGAGARLFASAHGRAGGASPRARGLPAGGPGGRPRAAPFPGFPCRRSLLPAGTATPSSARTDPRQAGGTPRPQASSRWDDPAGRRRRPISSTVRNRPRGSPEPNPPGKRPPRPPRGRFPAGARTKPKAGPRASWSSC